MKHAERRDSVMKEDNSLLIAVIVLLVLLVFSSGIGMMGFGPGGMMGMMAGTLGIGMMLFGWLFSVLVFIALILFIVWLVKQIQK
jgi:uncharacterized membrane protein